MRHGEKLRGDAIGERFACPALHCARPRHRLQASIAAALARRSGPDHVSVAHLAHTAVVAVKQLAIHDHARADTRSVVEVDHVGFPLAHAQYPFSHRLGPRLALDKNRHFEFLLKREGQRHIIPEVDGRTTGGDAPPSIDQARVRDANA